MGIDGISAEILKSIPWRTLQKIREAFEVRYLGQNKEEIGAWLDHEQIGEADERKMCAERASKVVLRLPHHLAGNGDERSGKKR